MGGIYHVFIVSKAGGLIFNYDHKIPETENEKTYSYPLDIQLKYENKRVQVAFGERDGVCIGHVLLAVNGQEVKYKELPDGRDVLELLQDKANFPLNLKFGRPTITTNEKIVLASIFYPLYALAVQLSPEQVGEAPALTPWPGILGHQGDRDGHLQAALLPGEVSNPTPPLQHPLRR